MTESSTEHRWVCGKNCSVVTRVLLTSGCLLGVSLPLACSPCVDGTFGYSHNVFTRESSVLVPMADENFDSTVVCRN